MKYISILTVIVALAFQSQCYSQENSKGISLKLKDLEAVVKEGKTGWSIKTVLTNHTRDTLFYVSSTGCEPVFYAVSADVDSVQLFTDLKECPDSQKQAIISLPPSGQRIVNIKINSRKPVTTSFKLTVYLLTVRAKNRSENISFDESIAKQEKRMLVVSNRMKIKLPVDDNKK